MQSVLYGPLNYKHVKYDVFSAILLSGIIYISTTFKDIGQFRANIYFQTLGNIIGLLKRDMCSVYAST